MGLGGILSQDGLPDTSQDIMTEKLTRLKKPFLESFNPSAASRKDRINRIIKLIEENEAEGKVKEIYDEIKKVRQIDKIPNFWKSLANSPETLERTWTSLQQVMKKGALDPVTKELI